MKRKIIITFFIIVLTFGFYCSKVLAETNIKETISGRFPNYDVTAEYKVEVTDNAHSCTRYDYITYGCLKGNIGSIDSLKVKGTLDEYDMGTLAILGNAGMVYLDLSEANFKSTQTIKT